MLEANGDRRPDLFGEALDGGPGTRGRGDEASSRRHFWVNELKTAPAACFNGAQDGDETAVDCGGAACYPCRCFLSSTSSSSGLPRHREDSSEGAGVAGRGKWREAGGVAAGAVREDSSGHDCGFVVESVITGSGGRWGGESRCENASIALSLGATDNVRGY